MANKGNKGKKGVPVKETQEKVTTKYDLKMQYRKEQEAKAKQRSRITRDVCLGVVAVAVIAVGVNVYNNYQEKNGPYITVGSHDIKKAEYEYYYNTAFNSFYNTYGSYASYLGLDVSSPLDQQSYDGDLTWKDYFDEQAVAQIQQVYGLYDDGQAAGFEYDASEEADEFIASVEEYAAEDGASTEEYLQSLFGEDITEKLVREYVERSAYASAYYDEVEASHTFTDDEISAYYAENSADYDSVDYMVCAIEAQSVEADEYVTEEELAAETESDEEIVDEAENAETEAADETEAAVETEAEVSDTEAADETEAAETAADETEAVETETETELSEEEQAALEEAEAEAEAEALAEAEAKANEMLAAATDADSFESLVQTYSTTEVTDPWTLDAKQSEIYPSVIAEWLFDDARQAGDTAVIPYEAGDSYYVVYFSDRYLDHNPTVNVRHILVSSSAETTDDMTDEEIEAAEAQAAADAQIRANEIYNEWKEGEATEESFAALADEYSDDSAEGGLYESVAQGDMVSGFDDWIFDESRQPGDVDVVESSYGYHVIYFVGEGEEEWAADIRATLLDEAMTEYLEEINDRMTVTDVRGELAYLHIDENAGETESEEE